MVTYRSNSVRLASVYVYFIILQNCKIIGKNSDLMLSQYYLFFHIVFVSYRYSMTPLMFASKKGHVGAIKVLLENGADINKQEQRGFSV